MSRRLLVLGSSLALGAGVLVSLSVSSCDDVCTLEARPSVIVRFFDPAGQQITSHQASSVKWWEVDDPRYAGGAWDPAVMPPAAIDWQDAECLDAACTEWIAGREVDGWIEVSAMMCGHEYIERVEVPMTTDGCHVDTQQLDISVDTRDCPGVSPPPPPIGCSPETRPSVLVQAAMPIAGGGYAPVPAQAVWAFYRPYAVAEPEAISGLCMDEQCTLWALGHEQPGTFEVQVQVCGQTFTQTVDVGMTADACHVDTEQATVVIDATACDPAQPPTPTTSPVPTVCDLMGHPSAIVSVVQDGGDVLIPTPTDSVWYTHGGRRFRALCVDEVAHEGGCASWVAGFELAGPMTISTEYCEHEVSEEIRVGKTADGCHVKTEFVTLEVATLGCLDPEPEPPVVRPPGPH